MTTAPSKRRLYIGKKYEDGDHYEEDIWNFLSDRVLPISEGQLCEAEQCMGIPRNPAETFLYTIEDGHVCYTYVCDPCGEVTADECYLSDREYPTTQDGYAIVPSRCS